MFRNGNDARQEMLPDGGCVVRFVNGDLKRVEGGTGVVVYTYAAARTTHTMHPSGLEVFEFPSGQVGGVGISRKPCHVVVSPGYLPRSFR